MKKLDFVSGKTLDREELKKINGGSSLSSPDSPSGGGATNYYYCCWVNAPTVCSICVPCTPSCTCVTGAFLVQC